MKITATTTTTTATTATTAAAAMTSSVLPTTHQETAVNQQAQAQAQQQQQDKKHENQDDDNNELVPWWQLMTRVLLWTNGAESTLIALLLLQTGSTLLSLLSMIMYDVSIMAAYFVLRRVVKRSSSAGWFVALLGALRCGKVAPVARVAMLGLAPSKLENCQILLAVWMGFVGAFGVPLVLLGGTIVLGQPKLWTCCLLRRSVMGLCVVGILYSYQTWNAWSSLYCQPGPTFSSYRFETGWSYTAQH